MSDDAVDRIERASALRRGVSVWYATFGGVGAWIVHLIFEASAVEWTHNDPRWEWTLHAATIVCATAVIVAMVLARRLMLAAAGAQESGSDDAGQMMFLGQMGLLVGAINLALILLEGAYVLLIPHR